MVKKNKITDYLTSFNNFFVNLSSTKYFAGISILIVNLSSRYLDTELSKKQKEFLSGTYIKKIIIFFVCYLGSRDIKTSLLLTLIYIIIVNGLLNETSDYYIFTKPTSTDTPT